MRKLEYESDTGALRERLQAIKKDILRIAKPFDGLLDDASIKVVREHLENRAFILNRMFGLHGPYLYLQSRPLLLSPSGLQHPRLAPHDYLRFRLPTQL